MQVVATDNVVGMTRPPKPAIVRAATKYVVREDGCWEWTAHRDKDGYGRIRGDAPESRDERAHRLIWSASHGEIPQGMVLDHICGRPWCVNPMHLRPMTPVGNVMIGDSPHARNARLTECPCCGGPYSPRRNGNAIRRYCRLCNRRGHAGCGGRR